MSKHFNLRFTLFLLISDLVLTIIALLLATQLRDVSPFGKELGRRPDATWQIPLPIYFAALGIWATTFVTLNVYTPRQVVQLRMELVKVIEATVFSWMILAGVLYFTYRNVSRLQYLYTLVFYILLICAHRVAVRGWFRVDRSQRHQCRVLVVGTGEIACAIAESVEAHAWMGLSLVGLVGNDRDATDLKFPVLGTIAETATLIQEWEVSEVVIALPRTVLDDTQAFVHELQAYPVNIRLVPDYFDLVFLRFDFENFSGMPLLSLKAPVLDPFQRLVKRTFDLTLTMLALIPALPVMAIIAFAIKLDSPGPILFRQRRIGEGGRLFTMYKFRSMHTNAEDIQDQVTTMDENGNPIHKHANDPRVTCVGRFLRRTSLDELPQIFNIIRGQMSLVGPRPELPWLVDLYEPWQRKRFEVPQGLTGWWQINGRSDKPMHLNTEEDLYYIQHYSLLLDLKILWRTIQTVILRSGAY